MKNVSLLTGHGARDFEEEIVPNAPLKNGYHEKSRVRCSFADVCKLKRAVVALEGGGRDQSPHLVSQLYVNGE